MYDRQPIPPLLVGALLAVALHLALVPLSVRALVFNERPRPNLRVVGLAAPAEAEAGRTIEVSFEVTNDGAATARTTWIDRVYLSDDGTLSPDDRPLAGLVRGGTLQPGRSYQARADATLPARVEGGWFLIVKADAGNRVLEPADRDDNTAVARLEITLPQRPDLVAKSITMPKLVEVDRPFDVTLVIANEGTAGTGASAWRDTLYVSHDDQVDPGDTVLATLSNDQPLAQGVDYRVSPPGIVVPEPYEGGAYLILQADADDDIEEYPYETNNVLAVPLVVRHSDTSKTPDPAEPADPPPVLRPRPKPAVKLEPKVKRDVVLGRDDAENRLAVAWISYEDFQKLQARRHRVVQPAVQQTVDPLEQAPLNPDPTPPRPPAMTPAQSAAPAPAPQPAPAERTLQAEQIEAQAAEPDPAPPVEQVDAQAPVEVDAEPTRQPAAQADVEPKPNVIPAEQAPARTDRPESGRPAQQSAAALPRVIGGDPERRGPASLQDSTQLEPVERAEAAGGIKPKITPADQIEAQTPEPQPHGQPASMTPGIAPQITDGQPTRQLLAETPAPDPEGRPATAEPRPGLPEGDRAPGQPAETEVRQPSETETRQPAVGRDREGQTPPSPQTPPARPTPAPRAEKEADPFDLTGALRVVPGRTVVRRGVEIQTVRPRFGVATRASVLPGNPKVKVRFDRDGKVIKAWITQSSGYPSVDVPIVASMYRWRAKGKRLAELKGPFEVEIHILLGPVW